MSEPQACRARALRDRLESLEEAGARGFDAPAIVLIEGLLERSRRLETAPRARVEARAEARITRLEEDFERARAAARASLDRLESANGAAPAALDEAFATGRFEVIARAELRQRDASQPPLAVDSGATLAYRDAVADFSCALSRARSPQTESPEAGLLNGRRLAERVLRAAEDLAPAYRRSLIVGLADLAALMHLPAAKTARKRC